MARKSKDPRKPSQAFLRATGQAASNDNANEPKTDAAVDDALTSEADILRRVIKELGGDDDDFELLKGLSDDEEEEEKPKPKKNQKPQVDEVRFLFRSLSRDRRNLPNDSDISRPSSSKSSPVS